MSRTRNYTWWPAWEWRRWLLIVEKYMCAEGETKREREREGGRSKYMSLVVHCHNISKKNNSQFVWRSTIHTAQQKGRDKRHTLTVTHTHTGTHGMFRSIPSIPLCVRFLYKRPFASGIKSPLQTTLRIGKIQRYI